MPITALAPSTASASARVYNAQETPVLSTPYGDVVRRFPPGEYAFRRKDGLVIMLRGLRDEIFGASFSLSPDGTNDQGEVQAAILFPDYARVPSLPTPQSITTVAQNRWSSVTYDGHADRVQFRDDGFLAVAYYQLNASGGVGRVEELFMDPASLRVYRARG